MKTKQIQKIIDCNSNKELFELTRNDSEFIEVGKNMETLTDLAFQLKLVILNYDIEDIKNMLDILTKK